MSTYMQLYHKKESSTQRSEEESHKDVAGENGTGVKMQFWLVLESPTSHVKYLHISVWTFQVSA